MQRNLLVRVLLLVARLAEQLHVLRQFFPHASVRQMVQVKSWAGGSAVLAEVTASRDDVQSEYAPLGGLDVDVIALPSFVFDDSALAVLR